MSLFLKIYDYFQERRGICFTLLGVIVAALVLLVCRLDFKEDITDFLPVDEDYHESMKIYQEITTADKIVLMFSLQDTAEVAPEKVVAGVERFGEILEEKFEKLENSEELSGILEELENSRIDYNQVTDIFEFVYQRLPYFLTEKDYARVDSLWRDDSFLRGRMDWVKEQISSPVASLFEPMYVLDPLGFGENLAEMLRDFQPETKYSQHDGRIFTDDDRNCIVSVTSPYGGSETNLNGKLMENLRDAKEQLEEETGVKVSLLGPPAIAVTNATQIKHDTILAVSISVIFILALLLYFFRNIRSLILIAVTTGFGFLFALGCIALFRDSISLIVIGIASIIIGIAVNYPLHYVFHLHDLSERRASSRENLFRNSLKDLVAPLLIGNITTVGAFLALVPLEAVAIRDLGLFSALMLVGTIIFVLIFLPQMALKGSEGEKKGSGRDNSSLIKKLSEKISGKIHLSLIFASLDVREKPLPFHTLSTSLPLLFFLLTVFFGLKSLETEFDTNMSHINYMTQEEREGMATLAAMRGEANGTVVYVTSSADDYDASLSGLESLEKVLDEQTRRGNILSVKNPSRLLPSLSSQKQNTALWQEFWRTHDVKDFLRVAKEEGFTDEAFSGFLEMTEESDFPFINKEDNEALATSVFTGFVGKNAVVAQVVVPNEKVSEVEEEIVSGGKNFERKDSPAKLRAFDLTSLNGRIADTLSDDFNYIGYACSLIVFLFLWLSFGRIELAIIAFLPMAFGWLWILGLMKLCGISFNIVNIILATFIFGQGDDYTIFITEGIIGDYKKKLQSGEESGSLLVSYQKSIILSALIMLVGIGSLIVAKHPAMHSLAEVTIIGMFVVVFMAWLIPPIAFRLFITYDKSLRDYLAK